MLSPKEAAEAGFGGGVEITPHGPDQQAVDRRVVEAYRYAVHYEGSLPSPPPDQGDPLFDRSSAGGTP